LGLITESDLVEGLSTLFAIPTVAVPEDSADPAVVRLIPAVTARRYDLFPVRRINGCLTVAMADPTHLRALDDVAFATGFRFLRAATPQPPVRGATTRHSGAAAAELSVSPKPGRKDGELIEATASQSPDLADLRAWADQAPVIRLVNTILGEAIAQSASDIH